MENSRSRSPSSGRTKNLSAAAAAAMSVACVERVKSTSPTGIRDVARAVQKSRSGSRRQRIGSISVFYGAGHLPDLERRLCAELGYRPGADDWRTAFDVNPLWARSPGPPGKSRKS